MRDERPTLRLPWDGGRAARRRARRHTLRKKAVLERDDGRWDGLRDARSSRRDEWLKRRVLMWDDPCQDLKDRLLSREGVRLRDGPRTLRFRP